MVDSHTMLMLGIWMVAILLVAFAITAFIVVFTPAGRARFKSPAEDEYHGNTNVDVE